MFQNSVNICQVSLGVLKLLDLLPALTGVDPKDSPSFLSVEYP
jgi:hypothetical protein